MAPIKALYGRRCLSPVGWLDIFEVRAWGTNFLGDSLDKDKLIQERLFMAEGLVEGFTHEGCDKVREEEKVEPEWDYVLLDQNLSFDEEPVAILDRQILKLRYKERASVKGWVAQLSRQLGKYWGRKS
ncbi:uncharacterized protein LOC132047403 [Lycium ferocissimum]|uniref:uncharacterized protein LOC132047403 n=1 Tax=Lycium ferocissimum TaxID=112874 RepID=UPI002815AD0F|nr:uncharacterized protein LOC132047403 [Lycium ferocissimum]